MLRTGDSAVEVGRRSVRPRRLGGADEVDPIGVVVEEMARQGFEPTVHRRRDGSELVLVTCPFATTALADSDTVCSLHLGIARGVAETTGGRVVVAELVPHDPRRANCRLRLQVHVEDGDSAR
jgi:predicted ArsR family transcriptional regulator